MARRTSIETYNEIRDSGVLSKMRMRVYDWLYNKGPATRSELDRGMRGPSEVNPSYHKRLSELERMGLAETVGERDCKVTGRQCLVWQTTDLANPHPLQKTTHKSKRVRDLEALAERAIVELEISCDRVASDASVPLREELDRLKG